VDLDPASVTAREWYGLYLTNLGRGEEARLHLGRALEIDPLNLTALTNLAACYQSTRRNDLALEYYNKAIELDSSFASAHDNLASTYLDMGKYELWIEESKKAAALAGDQDELAIAQAAARAYTQGGLRAALSRRIELRKQLGQRRYVDSGWIAYDYAALGDKDQAFYWLEKAYSEKSGSLGWIKVAKPMDSLRSDPRYIHLLERMGLPQ